MRVQRTTEVALTQDEVTKITMDYVNDKTSEKVTDEDIVEFRGGKKNTEKYLTFKSTDEYEVQVLSDT